MADDLDVESWLEAPYKTEASADLNSFSTRESHPSTSLPGSRESSRRHERDPRDRRSDSRDRRHRSSRHRSRSRETDRDRRSYRGTRRSRSPPGRHHREQRSSSRELRRTRSPLKTSRKERSPSPVLSEADRDQRTVFVIQLAARLTTSELREFFSKVGKVRDARIVSDRNSRRSKGVGYVEFYDIKSVEPALALTGTKLLGIPVIVQNTEAEKNRLAEASAAALRNASSPAIAHRLYIGNLQYNLTEEDLKLLFEPFGPIELIEIPKDLTTGRGRGYAFIQYRIPEDSKKALSQMNGFELGGRPIRVGLVSDKTNTTSSLDDPEDGGLVLNSQSRAELMKKLARHEDNDAMSSSAPFIPAPPAPILSRSVVLENMFDPAEETELDWETVLEEEVEAECNKYGKVVHIHLDRNSKGTIFVKFDSVNSGQQAIQALHGRWFGGRQVVAQFIPDISYITRFPQAVSL